MYINILYIYIYIMDSVNVSVEKGAYYTCLELNI